MAESKLVMDGREYPMPNLGDLTMGDARIIKRYTGMTLEQVAEADPTDPDLIASFCHLAIRAEEPRKSFADIEAEVDKVRLAKLEFVAEEEEESPPSSTQNESGSGSQRSGVTSDEPSDETPETNLPRIGMQA